MTLIVRNLSKSFSGKIFGKKNPVINHVSLEVPDGQVMAMIGQNGAGKTTLIKCLMGFLNADQGEILHGNLSVVKSIEHNEIGYMPEILVRVEGLTVKEYLQDLMSLRGLRREVYEVRLNELVDLLFMRKHLDKAIKNCSKGTQKKVLFIQAVLHNPKLVILDEPTDGLDPISRKHMLEEINVMKMQGTSFFLTTHLLADIMMVSDRIVVLQKGEIVEQREKEEISVPLDEWYYDVIMQKGNYSDLC